MSELADTLRAKVQAAPLDWDRALDDAKRNRETHVRWRKFLMANPGYSTAGVGDVRHHALAIEEYDNIIGCLAAHTLLAVAQVSDEAEGER